MTNTLEPPDAPTHTATARATAGISSVDECIPAEAALVMSALDAGAVPRERRSEARSSFRSKAMLWLFSSDRIIAPAAPLFTRDISGNGLGFVTRDRLPLGARGVVEVACGDGAVQRLPCTVGRCREVAPNWFEGSVCFSRPRVVFENA